MNKNIKLALTIVASFLGFAILMSVLGFATSGFTNRDVKTWFTRDLNADNFIVVEDYDLKVGKQKTDYGLEINVKPDGRIILNGANNVGDTEVAEIIIGSVTLAPGTYTLSGYKGTLNSLYVYAEVDGDTFYGDMSSKTFTIEEETTVVYGFGIKDGKYCFNTEILPVIVEGEKVGTFYIK